MIPLSDDNAVRHAPVASRTLLALCVAVFLWQIAVGSLADVASRALGFTPAFFFHGGPDDSTLAWAPFAVTLVTYIFLHGGWLHLAGNMLFLWIFGDDIEDAFGQAGFIVFFLLAGIMAALAQALPDPESQVTIIGASGAISGVLGAYLVLYPRAQVQVLAPLFIVMEVVKLPAWVVLAFWFIVQVMYELWDPQAGGGIAFRAHIGGFIAGMLMAPLFRRVCTQSGMLLR